MLVEGIYIEILREFFVITGFIRLRLQNPTEGLPEVRFWSKADRSGDDKKALL